MSSDLEDVIKQYKKNLINSYFHPPQVPQPPQTSPIPSVLQAFCGHVCLNTKNDGKHAKAELMLPLAIVRLTLIVHPCDHAQLHSLPDEYFCTCVSDQSWMPLLPKQLLYIPIF